MIKSYSHKWNIHFMPLTFLVCARAWLCVRVSVCLNYSQCSWSTLHIISGDKPVKGLWPTFVPPQFYIFLLFYLFKFCTIPLIYVEFIYACTTLYWLFCMFILSYVSNCGKNKSEFNWNQFEQTLIYFVKIPFRTK